MEKQTVGYNVLLENKQKKEGNLWYEVSKRGEVMMMMVMMIMFSLSSPAYPVGRLQIQILHPLSTDIFCC